MKKTFSDLALASLLLIAACADTPSGPAPLPPAPPPPVMMMGDCIEAAAQFAVGRPLDTPLQTEARTRSGATVSRIIRPGMVMTMDFDPQRLNLEVDANGKIVKARCG